MTYAITTSQGGGYTVADQSNLQNAINSLTNGGTVWAWIDFELGSSVALAEGVHLDFQGHRVSLKPQAGISAPAFVELSSSRCHVRNVVVVTPATMIGTLITVVAASGGEVSYNVVENVRHESESEMGGPRRGYLSHDIYGIRVVSIGGGTVRANSFDRIRFEGVTKGILLEHDDSPSGAIRECLFSDVFFDGFQTLLDFDAEGTSRIDRNLFHHVRGRAYAFTHSGFYNILGDGNHFDHCGIDHWSARAILADESDWTISSSATNIYICAHTLHQAETYACDTIFDPPHDGVTVDTELCTPTQRAQAGRRLFESERAARPLVGRIRFGD